MPITKKSAKKTAPKKRASLQEPPNNEAPLDTATPPTGGPEDFKVRIRMYRKWLGDCFLLTFRQGGEDTHIMIDCGALIGTPEAQQKVQQAVESIAADAGKLAALVVTHEHWDHVSGFSDAIDSFKKFSSIGEVWAAWTEDPTQTVVKESRKLRFNAVKSALSNWSASAREDDQQLGAAVCGLMDFIAPGGLAAFSEATDEAIKNALALGKQRLLNPGDVVDSIPGLRVYVLGPPQDTKALHRMLGKVGKDMYGLALSASEIAIAEALEAAAASQADPSVQDRYVPFEPYLHWNEPAWAKEWEELAQSYHDDPARKIDRDWLNTAAELALQLDSYTNNTSLVLAFELTESKEVLLFVGDAQVGNWQSWPNVKFSNTTVNAADLLARTVFYKVGHHGSHNATLKQGGLEAMTSSKLVAAIPVDEQFARNSKHWDMPAGPLLAALQEKTAGRILRGDSNFPRDASRPEKLPESEWQEFQQNTNVEEHFIEYFLR
jgi:metallo-beta-lactamase superfamily protein